MRGASIRTLDDLRHVPTIVKEELSAHVGTRNPTRRRTHEHSWGTVEAARHARADHETEKERSAQAERARSEAQRDAQVRLALDVQTLTELLTDKRPPPRL